MTAPSSTAGASPTPDPTFTALLSSPPWPRVDELIERAETVADLFAHRLHLYAAWRWRSLGHPVSPDLIEVVRGAAIQRLAVPGLLARIRRAYDGPLMLLKGAEVGAYYPKQELRPTQDIDLLAPDALAVQSALLAGGFQRLGKVAEGHHHLDALEWPGLPTRIEVHSHPSWPTWLTPPPTSELFEAATKECVLGHGILALPPEHHVLLLVAHIWREAPLRHLGHLVDIAVMAEEADRIEIERLARGWGLARAWAITDAAVDAVLFERPGKVRVSRFWLKDLEAVRDRSVIESKLAELVAPFWCFRNLRGLRTTASLVGSELRPAPGETWGQKLKWSFGAVRQGFQRRSTRDAELYEQKRKAA